MRKGKVEYNDFYCLNCGQPITLPRKSGHQYLSGHRKVLYCPFCRETVNHVECKTPEDVAEFRKNFELGVYKDEAEDSVSYLRGRLV